MISSLENVVADILKHTSFERIVKEKLSIYSNNKSRRKGYTTVLELELIWHETRGLEVPEARVTPDSYNK